MAGWPAAAGHRPPSRARRPRCARRNRHGACSGPPRSLEEEFVPIKTLLWIGPARGFPAELADDPRIDIAWEAHCPERAPECDLVVLDARADGADRWLAHRKRSEPPVLVWTTGADPDPQWLARGAAATLPSQGDYPNLAEHFLALCGGTRANGSPSSRSAFIAESAGMRAVAAL